jgi:predicted nucleic acid-binding protein
LIVYLDTSALVKLYVEEDGSASVRSWVAAADAIVSSRVAYPEARAALARRMREAALSAEQHERAVADLDQDWARLAIVELGADVARLAGDLAQRRGLRGFDAIHLASAVRFVDLVQHPVRFGCFDGRLAAAAATMGLDPP